MARRKGRIGGPAGIVMAVGAIAALFWNEGRSVDRIKTIATGRDAVVEGDLARVDPSQQGKLVHLVGPATGGGIADTVFKIDLTALRLDRRVDMYQWVETKKNRDGHTEYEYRKAWRNSRQGGFHDNRYVNPQMPYQDETFYPAEAKLGAYRLSRLLLDDLSAGEKITPVTFDLPQVGPLHLEGKRLLSGTPGKTVIGDLRIEFSAVPEQTVSVLAGVANGELLAFRTEHGDLAMIEPGAMDASAMLALAETRNAYLTWGLRLAGTGAIFLGIFLLLSSAVSWIPFAQGLAKAAAALIAIVLAVPIALSVIAFAWLWFRPLWAIGLFCVAALGPIFLVLRARKANRVPAMASAAPPPATPTAATLMQNDVGRGIVLMVLAMGTLAGMDAITKYLATRYDVPQILAIRFWIFLGFACAMAGPRNVPTLLRSLTPWRQLARSLIIVVEVGVFVVSFRYLPLADVHAITGIAPLLVTALAVPMLGERVGIRRWTAVAVGFVGLLIILRPGFGQIDPYLTIPFAGAFLWALYQVLTRQVSRDAPATSMLYMAGVGAIVMSCIAPFVWVPPTLVDWGALIALGIVGSFGHYLFIRAFQAAPASVLQPFHYTALVWATVIGWLVFDDLPDVWTVAGGLVIAASGIYAILRAEKVSRE